MNPIDAVISWVDGYDPAYQQKLQSFCAQQGIEPNSVVEPTRIQQCNEIHYCLEGIRRFAPWIRTIYLITNQQIPETINTQTDTAFRKKIKIIDQNDLLNAVNKTHPIFNSISVEWLIWHIPGLSKRFLYLNDDFFIIRPVKPQDFFHDDGLVIRGQWKKQAEQKMLHRIKKHILSYFNRHEITLKTNPHRAWQEKSARLAGWDKHFYLLPHAPFPLLKKTFMDYIQNNHPLFIDNLDYPFRHPDQVSSIPLMVHLDIRQGRSTYRADCQTIMVNGASHSFKKIKSRLHQAQQNTRVTFVCMQSMDQASPETQKYLIHWLEHHLGFNNGTYS